MPTFYQLSKESALTQLHSSVTGLTTEAVAIAQTTFGSNTLQAAKQKSKLSILLSQFTDVMIIILLLAAVISFFVGEHTDAYVILAIILGNAWMGYSQEYNAVKSVRLLQEMAPPFAMVLRNNIPGNIQISV